ncbi:MAG: prepilin-type N-terminal cleavage/methylation domain-containing protein [Chthonomonadales bacterium]
MTRNIRSKKSGFTLIELLVVVLILAILMSVALPLYLSAVGDSQKKTCRANMQTIANTVLSAKVRNLANDYGALITAGVVTTSLTDLTSVPKCPNGGAYTLANGSSGSNTTFQVKCDATGHGKFEPGIDSN